MFQDIWILGTQVMNKYYTIFDQTQPNNVPQVLIAEKNKQFDRSLKKDDDTEVFYNKILSFLLLLLIFLALILIVVCCCKRCKNNGEYEDGTEEIEGDYDAMKRGEGVYGKKAKINYSSSGTASNYNRHGGYGSNGP